MRAQLEKKLEHRVDIKAFQVDQLNTALTKEICLEL